MRKLVTDKNDILCFGCLLQSLRYATRTGTDIIEAKQVRILLQQIAHGDVVTSRVVLTFAERHDAEVRKILAQHLTEAEFALLVTAIAQAADDHCDLPVPLADEAAEQMAGGAPGCPIVDADIAKTPRIRQIRH